MAYNKVTYKDEILMDITDSTVTPETLSEGVIAYGANGERIVGTAISGGSVSAPLIVNSLAYEGELGNKTGYKSITIGSSVSMIDINAFEGCSNLEDVTFPETLEIISDSAFDSCSSITSITIPNSVTRIGNYAFSGCTLLETVNLSNSITSISSNSFYGCSALTNISISEGVTDIYQSAFSGCSSLGSIILPDTINTIRDTAFNNCSSLTSITYGGTKAQWEAIIKGIGWDDGTGDYTVHCTDGEITKQVANPEDEVAGSQGLEYTSNGDGTCYVSGVGTCTDTDLIIPSVSPEGDTVTSIGFKAFEGCSSLTNITIPDSVTSIGDDAFFYCTSLTSINIPVSVTSIDNSAFDLCSSLEGLNYGGTVAQWQAKLNDFTPDYDFTVYCTDGETYIMGAGSIAPD